MQIVFDAADPAQQAQFWSQALGYVIQEPPAGFDSWPAFLQAQGVPEDAWNSASAAVDPTGSRPRLLFQQVPEPKTTKNRLHIDLQSGGGPSVPAEEQRRRVEVEVARLTQLGATYVLTTEELGVVWAIMLDPEGNEFCA
ncbi:MAG: hypothetical protein JWM76_495 [Pseudonocardiales bacterium]|nr:hypothetical protein [Pseudonocardiales bacterium]